MTMAEDEECILLRYQGQSQTVGIPTKPCPFCKLSIENDVGNVCISMEEVFYYCLILKKDEVVSPNL